MSNNEEIIDELKRAYWSEIETIMNYLAHSVNLDGVQADVIKKSLTADVSEELAHAQMLAKRIKELGGITPGSKKFKVRQEELQPLDDTTEVITVIYNVIQVEEEAIKQYKKIIRLCETKDYVTQDLAIRLLSDEESHKSEFESFLKEFKH
jgi:bacterioferritin